MRQPDDSYKQRLGRKIWGLEGLAGTEDDAALIRARGLPGAISFMSMADTTPAACLLHYANAAERMDHLLSYMRAVIECPIHVALH